MRFPRYRFGARYYDVLSLERWLYRSGRRVAVALADVRPGDRVLDVGCGTGLSLPALTAAVGGCGQVVGLDASAAMLRAARRRVDRHGWPQVSLLQTDAGNLPRGPFDVILFCYSLSVVDDWRSVWTAALPRLAPNGRVAVVDTTYPRGVAMLLAPAIWLFISAGGVHPRRRVWEVVARDMYAAESRCLLRGHVRVAAGRTSP